MSSSRGGCHDRRRLALSLIAIISNASYTTIAPILPLEIDKHNIPEQWVSLIFLAFSIGSSISPPLVARHFESIGTVKVMAYSMIGMSITFWFIGHVFEMAELISSNNTANHHMLIIGMLTCLQFFLGAFFSIVTTGYYSLATLIFTERECIMSYVEASVGIGYILGPIVGSFIYDEMGYQYAFSRFISLGMLLMAIVTLKVLSKYLKYKYPDTTSEADDSVLDVEAQSGLISYNSLDTSSYSGNDVDNNISTHQTMNIERENVKETQQITTISLLKFPKILIGAQTILFVNTSWTFLEPLLAKRLDNFHVGKKGIGIIFSSSSIVYVPTVFLVQYLPTRHVYTITISVLITPLAVLLTGFNSLPLVVCGVMLLGILPTPVFVMLLPWMNEESQLLFPNKKRRVNDITASIYNSFMTLGQVVGYLIGPMMKSHGFTQTTKLVAFLIFVQSILFYFGAEGYIRYKKWRRTRYVPSRQSTKQTI